MKGHDIGDFYGVSVDYGSTDNDKWSIGLFERPGGPHGGWRKVEDVRDIERIVVLGDELRPGEEAFVGRDDDNRYRVAITPGDRLARIERTDDLTGSDEISPYGLRDRSSSPQGSEFDFTGGGL